MNLGRTYNPALNVGKLNLGRLDHLGKLSQVVIEHASVFTRTRDELLGGRRRDRLAVLRRHLLHAARKLPALGAGAIDHGLLVDLGDRLIQARVLGKRVSNDEADRCGAGTRQILDKRLRDRLGEL